MDEKSFYKNLGVNIKFLREQFGLTQEKLAEKAGISLDYMGKIEVSINRPGLKTILKLARALEVEPYQILKFKSLTNPIVQEQNSGVERIVRNKA